jgi:excisionase family DNA binding protein
MADTKGSRRRQLQEQADSGRDEMAAEIRRMCVRLESQGLILDGGIKIGRTRFIKIKLPDSSSPAAGLLNERVGIGRNRYFEILESPKIEGATEILARVRRTMQWAKLNVEPVRLGKWILVPITEKTNSESVCRFEAKKALLSSSSTQKTGISSNPSSIVADRVERKLQNPGGNPTMTIVEVAYALGKSKSTIYRMLEDGVLLRTNVPGAIRIRTESVISLLQFKTT